jgi:hypothetical protein
MSAILSATDCTIYTQISASAQTIINKKLLDTVEARIPIILNNYFTSDNIQIQSTCKFYASNNSIILDGSEHWEDYGFQANDTMFIYRSYRNEGYKIISSLSNNIAMIASTTSVIKEDFNNSNSPVILFTLANWPIDVKMIAYEMAYYDNDVRSKRSPGITSRSLGPLSESYTVSSDNFGYPMELLNKLEKYSLVRVS